jgi:outer membrane protein TolC
LRRIHRIVLGSLSLAPSVLLAGQRPDVPEPRPLLEQGKQPISNPSSSETSAPLQLTLQAALDLARKNSTQWQTATTEAGVAHEDRNIARAGLLPGVNFNTSALYTETNSAGSVKYIANNAPHEYTSQGNVHQQFDLAVLASYRSTAALALAAKARKEVTLRGLVVTVVQDYFTVAAAEQKLSAARHASEEGDSFFQLTQNLEKGGEVAHADVIKAELQMQERHRQMQEAQLALLNARLELSVLIFPDYNDNFQTIDDLHAKVPLLQRDVFEAAAGQENPDIRAALASAQAAKHDVEAARAGYLPSISLDYFYGIDAPNYAVNSVTPDGKVNNLGSSAMASLNLPVWNWGTTQSRVRQAELRRDLAKKELSFAQRKLLVEMRSLYSEAETSLNELSGLQRSAELAADSLKLTTLRYKNGESTVLEVVDAQSTFATANAAYQDGALRYRVALANLQTLTGVLPAP